MSKKRQMDCIYTPHAFFFAPSTSKFMQKKAPTLKGYTVKERIFQKNWQKKSINAKKKAAKKSVWGVGQFLK